MSIIVLIRVKDDQEVVITSQWNILRRVGTLGADPYPSGELAYGVGAR